MMNENLVSIHLFTLLAVYAFSVNLLDIAIACTFCYVFGLLNHLHDCQVLWLSRADQTCVWTISIIYVVHTIFCLFNFAIYDYKYLYGVLAMTILTCIAYFFVQFHPLVHFLAYTGILMYCLMRQSL